MQLTLRFHYSPTAPDELGVVSVNCEFDWLADAKRVAVEEASIMPDCVSVDLLDARGSAIFHWQRKGASGS